jgi:hypothetical protein
MWEFKTMRSKVAGVLIVAVSLMLMVADASAQMNNKPFSFGSSGGSSLGMSAAAKQAILNKELTGATPDNIMRGPGGALIEITSGPSNIAIATGQDGVVLQGYHGRSGVLTGSAGAFNPYFYGGHEKSPTFTTAHQLTSNAIAGWTSMVSGRQVYSGGDSIDAWTSLIGG